MTGDQLGTAAFVFADEGEQWKLVKFAWDNVFALRSCGECIPTKGEDEARAIVKRRAAQALIRFYHSEMAKGASE